MTQTISTLDVLSRRALNRATLERQLLLRRSAMSALDAVEHLVGMQAQVPTSPYLGLWSRLQGFDHADISSALVERKMVRIVVMRGTIHLVSARDCLRLRPVVQPVLTRTLWSQSQYGRGLQGIDIDALLAAGREILEEKPRSLAELRIELAKQWPDRDANALGYGVHYMLPLVQLPPRGVWGASSRPICTTAEKWLGKPLAKKSAPGEMIVRYLRAFGPASAKDVQAWSGLGSLREEVDKLRPKLRVYRDEKGVELFDLAEVELPDPDTPAPVRFLPEFDNLILSHADRTRVVPERYREIVKGNLDKPFFLVDGMVAGTCRLDRDRTSMTLAIMPYEKLSPDDRAAVLQEAEKMMEWMAQGKSIQFSVRL